MLRFIHLWWRFHGTSIALVDDYWFGIREVQGSLKKLQLPPRSPMVIVYSIHRCFPGEFPLLEFLSGCNKIRAQFSFSKYPPNLSMKLKTTFRKPRSLPTTGQPRQPSLSRSPACSGAVRPLPRSPTCPENSPT